MYKVNRFIAFAIIASIVIPLQFFCTQSEKTDTVSTPSEEKKDSTNDDPKKRGEYLVLVGGCTHCHTPKVMTQMGPEPDPAKFLSGHPAGSPLPAITYDATKPGGWMLFAPDLTALVGPWGISFSANLTPDSATGIGNWSAEVFKRALKTGKHMGDANGRPILPPMPWQDLAKMEEADLDAVYAYLRSIPAIKNQVPMPVPPNEVMKRK